MTYFNNTDANFYPISDVPEELGCYPFVEQTPATEGVGMADNSIFPDWWTTAEQVVPVARSPTNFWTTANNCGPVASATSYATWGNSYGQPEYPVHDWPAAGQQVTYHHPGFSSWDVSLASVAVPETLAVAPTPGSVPFDHWGADQGEFSIGASHVESSGTQWPLRDPFDTFTREDLHTLYPLNAGPTRTGILPVGRFQPYGMSRARSDEHRNAAAGPSTLVLPPVPYVDRLTSQPPGGMSEASADAEKNKQCTEEVRATKPKQTRLRRGQGKPRPSRVLTRGDGHKLCNLIQRRKKLLEAPSFNKALKSAVKIIRRTRLPVYREHRLQKGKSKRTKKGLKSADDEYERRNVERGLYRELSQYYELGWKQEAWTRPPLLLKVLEELQGLTTLPE